MAQGALTMVYGINAVCELLKARPSSITQLWLDEARSDQRMTDLLLLANEKSVDIQQRARSDIEQWLASDGIVDANHQGVAAQCREAEARDGAFLKSLIKRVDSPFLLLLDGVTDPHNLGACLRSANAAGVDAVIVPKDNAAGLTAVVRKVACGAAELTPLIQVTNFARCMQQLQENGVWLMGAAGETKASLYSLNLKGSLGIVMGSEGKGLRRLTRERCDHLFAIPMAGSVESLNVSVATGISLFEAQRQRLEL